MTWRDLIIGVLLVIVFFQGILLISLKTGIADYDIKADHLKMETRYCPYCGKLLEQE